MIRKCVTWLTLLFVGLALSAFSSPAVAASEEGNPWWIWLVVLAALAVFVGFVLWWWLYKYPEEGE